MTILITSIIFILGLLIGSFLNVCIYRIPRRESIISPPSHCPSCGHRLSTPDLVPVLSWVFLRGKCRYCSAKISPRYMIIELLTAILFLTAYLKLGVSVYLTPALILTSLLIAASFIDLEHTIIPNGLVLTGIVAGLAFAAFAIIPGNYAKYSLNALDAGLGFLAGGLPLYIVNLLSKLVLKKEGMGGGDVKLMAMAGIFLGWKLILLSLLLAIYLGGIAGLVIIIIKRRRQRSLQQDEQANTEGHYMPFGPFLAIGCYMAMVIGSNLISWYIAMI